MRYVWKSCLLALGFVLQPGAIRAQVVLGTGCSTLTQLSGQQQAIALSQSAAANRWVVVSVALNNTFAQFDPAGAVTDSAGNSYPIYDTVALSGGSGILATFAGRAANALNAGGSVYINYTTTGSSSTQACATAAAFPGVLALSDPSDAAGEGSSNGSSFAVTSSTPTQFASDLVYSVFASAASPGAIAPTSPAQGLGGTCSADTTLCLQPAWNLGAPLAGIQESADAQSANSVPWGAVLITFQSNDRIFANGFE
jgi:hypothetical protein